MEIIDYCFFLIEETLDLFNKSVVNEDRIEIIAVR